LRNELERLARVAVGLEESKKDSPAAVNVHS